MAQSNNKFATTLTYNEPITASNITVEYDGHLCNVARDEFGGYGNEGLRRSSASEGLPFYIIYEDSQNIVYTSTLGQHTIEISISESSVKTTECFKKAVKSCIDNVIVAETNRPQKVSLSPEEGRTPYDTNVVFADVEDVFEKYWVEMELKDLGGTRSIHRFPILMYEPNGVMLYEGDNSSNFYLATPTEGWHINFFSPNGGITECIILPTSANVLQGN